MEKINSESLFIYFRIGLPELVHAARKQPLIDFVLEPANRIGTQADCLRKAFIKPRRRGVQSIVERGAGVPQFDDEIFQRKILIPDVITTSIALMEGL